MSRKYSLSIHDLKVSENDVTAKKIKYVLNVFGVPLTVHLVFDRPFDNDSELYKFLKDRVSNRRLEVVFHGTTHQCSKGVPKTFAFYHKYQAEYLDDSDSLRISTRQMFSSLTAMLECNVGICPPCWIALKKNFNFLQTLNPLYIESLLSISFGRKKLFSPVISLGSPNNGELFLLKALARTTYVLSLLKRRTRLRIAIHECDLSQEDSMKFFSEIMQALNRHSFNPVLLSDME